jgi:hypothetical protein
MKVNNFFNLCFIFGVLLSAFTTFGEAKTFIGPLGGLWYDPFNWSPYGVPGFADDVHIGLGSNVDASGLPIVANNIQNDGIINNAANLVAGNMLINNGFLNNIADINVFDFFNAEDAQINNVENIAVMNGFVNDGIILGKEGVNLQILIFMGGALAIGFNGEHGAIFAQGENGGIVIRQNGNDFINRGHIEAPAHLKIIACGFRNELPGSITAKNILLQAYEDVLQNDGEITSSGGTSPAGFGNEIELIAVNNWGNGTLINSGTIQGGDGAPSQGGDNIYISADIFRNLGLITSGLNGTGADYGGEIKIKARNVQTNPESLGTVQTPPTATEQTIFLVSDSSEFPSSSRFSTKTTADRIYGANYLYFLARKMTFGNIPLNSIFASDYMEVYATNGPGNVLDFSGVTAGPIFAGNPGGSINIRGSNLIPPPIGYNAMCEPDPTVSSGSIANTDLTVISLSVMSFTGHSGSFEVMIRNEHAIARNYNYTVNSLRGWFAPVSGTTPDLDPWETHSFFVHFNVPSGLTETTIDTVATRAQLFPMWETFKSTITAFPFDTLPTPVAVEEKSAFVPDAMTISANPNPFNSSVRITLDGLGAHCNTPLQIEIYDVNGRMVEGGTVGAYCIRPFDGSTRLTPTTQEYIWTPHESLPSGVYLVRATMGVESMTKRIVYLR